MAGDTLGSHLKATRKELGFTLEEVAEETKIAIYVLRAMEADRWDTLPAEVFIKGFLRSYAEVLGLDPQEVLERYCRESGLCAQGSRRVKPPPRPMEKGRAWLRASWLWIAVAAAAVAALGAVLYLLR